MGRLWNLLSSSRTRIIVEDVGLIMICLTRQCNSGAVTAVEGPNVAWVACPCTSYTATGSCRTEAAGPLSIPKVLVKVHLRLQSNWAMSYPALGLGTLRRCWMLEAFRWLSLLPPVVDIPSNGTSPSGRRCSLATMLPGSIFLCVPFDLDPRTARTSSMFIEQGWSSLHIVRWQSTFSDHVQGWARLTVMWL